jgi:hypothetical protein
LTEEEKAKLLEEAKMQAMASKSNGIKENKENNQDNHMNGKKKQENKESTNSQREKEKKMSSKMNGRMNNSRELESYEEDDKDLEGFVVDDDEESHYGEPEYYENNYSSIIQKLMRR